MSETPVEVGVIPWDAPDVRRIPLDRPWSPQNAVSVKPSIVLMGCYKEADDKRHYYRLMVGKTFYVPIMHTPEWKFYDHWMEMLSFMPPARPVFRVGEPLETDWRSAVIRTSMSQALTVDWFNEWLIPLPFYPESMGEALLPLIEEREKTPLQIIADQVASRFKVSPKEFIERLLPVLINRYTVNR